MTPLVGARASHERTTAAALQVVGETVVASARQRAADAVRAADDDAQVALGAAREESRQIVDRARAEGTAAARYQAGRQLTAARREARELVLGARRAALEEVRHRALVALAAQADTPAGSALSDRLETLVRRRVGPGAAVHREGAFAVSAASDGRRAGIGPAELVDEALCVLAEQVVSLWS